MNLSIYSIISLSFALATNAAFADTCVKTRDGERFACMKFSASETKGAAKYGVRLAEPFKIAKQKLLKQGWQLDRKYVSENSSLSHASDEMICGSGWDAICSAAFKRGNEVLYLKMSGTNEGIPLIYVGTED